MSELGAFLLPIWIAALAAYVGVCGVAGAEPGAPWWLRWPHPIWNAIAHDWRSPAAVPQLPDYAKIARLERELGIVQAEPERPVRPARMVCLTKDCAGETHEIRTWSGTLLRRIHDCEAP